MVVSKTSVFEVDVSACNSLIRYQVIFNNQCHASTSQVIKDAEFSLPHQSLYMMLRNDDDKNTLICKLRLGGTRDEVLIINNIHKLVDRFEVSTKNPFNLFLVCQRNVYLYILTGAVDFFKAASKSKKKAPPKFKIRSKYSHDFGSKKFVVVYSNQYHPVRFFKFDSQMKYFFTHDSQLIKKCSFETKQEVHSLLDEHAVVRNVWFADNFRFMIR